MNPIDQSPEPSPTSTSIALQPVITDLQTDSESIVQNYAEYAQLTEGQKSVLLGLMDDFLSEDIRSDIDLAAGVGVHRNTVKNAKQNPRFNRVLIAVMPELVKSKLPKYLNQIELHGKKSFEPLKFLLEYTGLYVKSQRNLNLNANLAVNADQSAGPGQAVQSFCQQFMTIGYDKHSLLDLVAETWDKLKSEGL